MEYIQHSAQFLGCVRIWYNAPRILLHVLVNLFTKYNDILRRINVLTSEVKDYTNQDTQAAKGDQPPAYDVYNSFWYK